MTLKPSTQILDILFHPRSVAIIGASNKPHRIGFQVVKSLTIGKYPGKIYPVNPRLKTVLGHRAYRTIEDVPADIDLGIIVLRKDRVPEAVEASARKGIHVLIVMTSGYSEVGDKAAEDELVSLIRKHGIRMLGPNCAGFGAVWEKIFASFENRIEQGPIAFVSQSGAMVAVILALGRVAGLGFSMFVSYGNAADLGPEEILQYLGSHQPTKLIGLYLEGVQEARRFLSVARDLTPKKPIVALKPGDTSAGVRAIQSHTGAMAGEQFVYAGAFRQAGVLQARTLDEFIDACKILATQPLPKGRRVAIVTNSGGPGVLAVDACARAHLSVKPFSDKLIKQFQAFLPAFNNLTNPVDVGPEGDAAAYQRIVEILLSASEVDIILVLNAPPVFSDIQTISQAVVRAKKTNVNKPLVTSWLAGDIVAAGLPILDRADIPSFSTPQRAATALRFLVQRAEWLQSRLTS